MMTVAEYLTRSGLTNVTADSVQTAQRRLWAVLDEVKKASQPATPKALHELYQYRVPKLSPDGSCSLFEELDETPYDLAQVLGGRTIERSMSLLVLRGLVEATARETRSDWLGAYQAREVASGRALVKLAYIGVPSRAEFPLTEAFAEKSNNAAVGLSGKARIIDDVSAYRDAGGSYYECDPKVKAEACLPLFDAPGQLVGIIDAEAERAGTYDAQTLAALIALALEVPTLLP